ncbi:hypothetical protein [Oceanobacillus alkalisoli]|uniref:hypothetical protein n=1 Tax=Oceanobacillus alkalisoli TaxID=2925113 RepID=UPI001F11D80E|nr:hypothetical protein [Oceanobacillus alkalisoli]MCF3944809.1 hypothetical protein [Oceanobacillus alkalisoli]
MNNFLKLVNFELGRFIKVYFILAGITVASQLIGMALIANDYLEMFNEEVYTNGTSIELFVEYYGEISLLNLQYSQWFNLPITFAVAVLIIYSFFIWYRDWLGKNTFIYRLLMLPTARINIYLAKASAIFLMVLGLVALQVVLLNVESSMLKWMVPANLRADLGIMESIGGLHSGGSMLAVIIPTSFIQFLIHYGVGFMVVFILFTAILFERSYRFKGIAYGVGYAIVAFVVFFAPFVVEIIFGRNYLFPTELFILEGILWIVVTGSSIWVSNYLLNKKVTV